MEKLEQANEVLNQFAEGYSHDPIMPVSDTDWKRPVSIEPMGLDTLDGNYGKLSLSFSDQQAATYIKKDLFLSDRERIKMCRGLYERLVSIQSEIDQALLLKANPLTDDGHTLGDENS